jgi:ATP-dependent Clp protease ATP-binding subunit ClpB
MSRPGTRDILTRGSEMLARRKGFKLVGRDTEISELSAALMKLRRRNVVVTGRGGVGISAIVLGLQASKQDYTTPVDIVGKRFFWLNTDALFESGNNQVINEAFTRARETLSASHSAVLVVEDASDFIKFTTMNGCSNLVNGLMGDLKANRYQAILETSDEGLADLLKCDGDLLENCTLYEVKEPDPQNLRLIVREVRTILEAHHGVGISEGAVEAAVALTEKYKLTELRAQPDAAITLLDLSMTNFCRQAHIAPHHIELLKEKLKSLGEKGAGADEVRSQLTKAQDEWNERQRQVRALYQEMSDGEEQIRVLEDEAHVLNEAHAQRVSDLQSNRASAGYSPSDESGDPMAMYSSSDTPEVIEIRRRIDKMKALVASATEEYAKKVAEVYKGLSVEESHVLRSFSALSGIPVDKLTENERVKLRNLEEVLSRRVVGQGEPTSEVAKAVKRARLGLKLPNKPAGTFMFLGPSGVGKTELAKALAEALSVPLLRFDMSEYMEKHAVAKLIGAPPGYEGYEHGGILTNQVRRNPYSVVLFDEIEKAHGDVFNLMLQLLDDARLTDSRGLTASFKDTIVIMTTNIGTPNFLDETISFEEAKKLALADLRSQYRPEFLGRFGGNIYSFQRLGVEVLEAIAVKELARINTLIKEQGIRLVMDSVEMRKMVGGVYVAREGARSILGYMDRNITSSIADLVLSDASAHGDLRVSFDPATRAIALVTQDRERQESAVARAM